MAAGIVLCGSLSRWAVPLGAAMHRAGYRAVGLDWCYVPFEISDLAGALTGMRALDIRGFGVSMPFKQQIMPLLDELDPLAGRIGAVNTVVNQGGRLVGHNTDWLGAVRALEEVGPLAGKRVLVLGAGGAARAVAFGLRERQAHVWICNRSDERAAELAEAIGAKQVPWRERGDLDGFDVAVNATSLGMAEIDPASPLPAEALHRGLLVMDIVYKPLATRLVAEARQRGLRVVDGGRMLLHQAARQFELYTGLAAPLEAMAGAMLAVLEEQKS